MSIFVLKAEGNDPMLVGYLGMKGNEGIYIEIEEENVPKEYRCKVGELKYKYMRSGLVGITCGKYFKKIEEPLDFEPIKKEKFEILNDNNKKFNLAQVIKILEETDKNSLYSISFKNIENEKFYLEAKRLLTEEEIEVQEHEFKKYENNFRGMYKFHIKISFDSLNQDEVNEIKKDYYKRMRKLDLAALKTIINKYNLKIADETNFCIHTSYEKTRTCYYGIHSFDINNINEIMTFAEAAKKWHLNDSTLRKLITTNKLKENIEYRKSGKVWLITKNAMEKIYGEPIN